MGFDPIALAGVFLISFGLSYAWWVKIRVIRLREDLFELRDELFDSARDLGELHDPAYKRARKLLNGCIRMAGSLSAPTALFAIIKSEHDLPGSEDPQSSPMQAKIDETFLLFSRRLGRYIFRETATGIGLSLLVWLVTRPTLEEEASKKLDRFIRSGEPTDLAALTV